MTKLKLYLGVSLVAVFDGVQHPLKGTEVGKRDTNHDETLQSLQEMWKESQACADAPLWPTGFTSRTLHTLDGMHNVVPGWV